MPAFANPTIDQTLGPGPSIAVRWKHDGDNLSDGYYALAAFDPGLADSAVRAVEDRVDLTASHELTLRFHALDAYAATHTALAVRVVFPDTKGFVSCHHPGTADQYYIDVTLTFDPGDAKHPLVSAHVSPMQVSLGEI